MKSLTITKPSFALLLIVFLSLAAPALSQTTPALPAGSLEPATAKSAASAETVTPVEKAAIVPVIGAGDLLKVSIFGAPESDQEVRVGAGGDVWLNFVGAVHVAGLSAEQAQAKIAKALVAGGFFAQPQVSVFIKEYATQGVSVLGEVLKPGVYPLLGSRRLFDVLALAGGTTPKAGRVVSITRRDSPQQPAVVSLSNDPAKAVGSNVDIFPGDTVVVSTAGVVYVVGDVRKPSGVIMESGTEMTVLQAIAMAEGTSPTASLNRAKLIRKTSSGDRQEIPLALKNILAGDSPDIRVQADDIIFVPGSAVKGAGKRSLEAIIQAATGVAIYRR